MDFKKDYINYVLHTIIQNEFYGARDDVRIRKILEKIIITPDVAKATFLTGKTAGLEILFKYLLYISDKIDKSQITVFNLKDNFDYDIHNLKKICGEIKKYRSITKPAAETETLREEETAHQEPQLEVSSGLSEETEESKTDESTDTEEVTMVIEKQITETDEETDETETQDEETTEEEQVFTLIENRGNGESDEEVFGLAGITRSVEMEEAAENLTAEDVHPEEIPGDAEEDLEIEEELIKEIEIPLPPAEEYSDAEEDEILTATDIEKLNSIKEKEDKEKEDKKKQELEIEIKTPSEHEDELPEDANEGTVTSEVYYRFENKFFEEVKILEKLFSNTGKECKGKPLAKLSEKSLQRFSEIIEISSELANLTRQLSLDLTADIFLTINLLFTKAINNPSLINPERTKLLSSSLLLVTSLIKGEDYLGYDDLVKKIEALKEDIKKPAEPKKEIPEEKEIEEEKEFESTIKEEIPQVPEEEVKSEQQAIEPEEVKAETEEQEGLELIPEKQNAQEPQTAGEQTAEPPVSEYTEYPKEIIEKPAAGINEAELRNMETVLFKMKYMVKEFEKIFINVSSSEGELTKFEILDEIDNLNNLLRMLAKISSSVKNADVLKLSEVSYVFLKYLKDYRMNLLDTEIQQIIKYIIFTYKMLLTDRKPEDFEKLVQYLNNPVKIFTDT